MAAYSLRRTALIAALGMLMTGSATLIQAATPGEVRVGATLRDAQMDPLIGPSRKLSEFRGKPLVINVWASWCGPCRAEMGSLQRLSRRFGGKQMHVIGISTDDYRDRASGFLRAYNITFPNYIDHALQLENMLGADRLPLTLLVDAQGKVLAKYYGSREWDSAEALRSMEVAFKTKL